MITINLLVGGQAEPRGRRALVPTICIVATCLTAVTYGAVLQQSRGTLRARAVESDSQSTESSILVKRVEDLRKRRDELLRTLAALRRVLEERSTSRDLFEGVSRSLPEGVWLTALNQSLLNIQIDGRAASLAEVTGLVHRLDANVRFTRGPELRSLSAEAADGMSVLRFQIVGELAPTEGDSLP